MQLALEKKERLSPSPCMHTASIWGDGTFCLDREFSKNAPYKQKIIFNLVSSDKMSRKKIFFAWTVDQWYQILKWEKNGKKSFVHKRRHLGGERLSQKVTKSDQK